MEIRKNLPGEAALSAPEIDLAEINRWTKRPLTAEEVYTFSVRLCDNEVDRDGERFTEETLSQLAALFVGKSGIFDHNWSAKEQTARIYHAEVCREEGKLTAAGDPYCYVRARAYMLRSEKNAPLIEEIEGGIKKEVSVGCSVGEAVCSVCGAQKGACSHVSGEWYDGKLCCTELRGAEDAYEWSFVAVPAQRAAGVMKAFAPGGESLRAFVSRCGSERHLAEFEGLEKEAALGRSYLKGLRREVLRLCCTAETELDGKIFAGALEKLEEKELLELQRVYRCRAERSAAPQLPYGGKEAAQQDGSAFLI